MMKQSGIIIMNLLKKNMINIMKDYHLYYSIKENKEFFMYIFNIFFIL